MERNEKGQFQALKLDGQTINNILLIEKTDMKKNGGIVWKCKCFCGNIFYAHAYRIKNGEISSCGCKRRKYRKDNFEKARKELDKNYVDNTFIKLLSNDKLYKNNKSGYKGISIRKNKYTTSYVVRIGVQNKVIHIGTFKTLEDAIAARKAAEEKYFKPILDKYKGNN